LKRVARWSILAALGLGSFGVAYEAWSRYSAKKTVPPPGKLVQTPWGVSHLHCLGVRRPEEFTLLLQAGLDVYGSLSWEPIHYELSRSRRVCAYDRAGMLWSTPRDAVRDGNTISDELNVLLDMAGEVPPYVVVGHSRGGLLSIVYSGRYPKRVHGLVLIDSSHFDQANRLPPGASFSGRSAPPSWLASLVARSGWFRIFDPYPYGQLSADLLAAKHFMPTSMQAFVAEWSATKRLLDEAAVTKLKPRLPVLVLSRAIEPERLASRPDSSLVAQVWRELQLELAGLTECGTARTIEGAGHYIHHDKPKVVVQEIDSFVAEIAVRPVCEND